VRRPASRAFHTDFLGQTSISTSVLHQYFSASPRLPETVQCDRFFSYKVNLYREQLETPSIFGVLSVDFELNFECCHGFVSSAQTTKDSEPLRPLAIWTWTWPMSADTVISVLPPFHLAALSLQGLALDMTMPNYS